jgi:hypothetical protein
LFLLAGLAVVIGYQLITGQINTTGLLMTKDEEHSFSPTRLQLLIATIGGAFYYLLQVLSNPNAQNFPDVPDYLLMIVGGSNLLYLGGKSSALLGEKVDSLMLRNRAGRRD